MSSGGSEASRSATFRRCLLVAGTLAGLVGLGVSPFALLRSREPPVFAPRATTRAADARARHAAFPRPLAVEPEQVHAKLSIPNPTAASRESPPREDVVSRGLRHPHPITPEHERIFEENSRVGALNDAMDRGDFAALRRLNAQYRRDYPDDAHVLHDGYALIADCLEGRSSRTHAAARRFWQKQRASSLRRYVRRHCLEGEGPP